MEASRNIVKILNRLARSDKRYKLDAYRFTLSALHFSVSRLKKPRHLTGRELSLGLKDYAVEQYGPMARTVIESWGIRRTADIGYIVYQLIDAGLLRKDENDRLEDFENVYLFDHAFENHGLYKLDLN